MLHQGYFNDKNVANTISYLPITASSLQRSLSFVPKVAVVEKFVCSLSGGCVHGQQTILFLSSCGSIMELGLLAISRLSSNTAIRFLLEKGELRLALMSYLAPAQFTG